MAPLDQPRLASLPTRGRVHRPGLPRRRVPGDEFPETTSAEAPPQTRAQQKLLHRGRVQRKPVERKRVERKRAQRSRSASPPEQRSEDFARHSAARAGADLWSPQVPHGDHNTALGDPGAVWMSPTPTPLILRVRDLRLVERSILSRPRATSSQLGLWLRQQSREDTAPNPRSARGTRGTSRTYARRLARLARLAVSASWPAARSSCCRCGPLGPGGLAPMLTIP